MDFHQHSTPIECVYQRSPDAEFILDDDLVFEGQVFAWNELDWREGLIPVSAFSLPHRTIAEHLSFVPCQTLDEGFARVQSIIKWVNSSGGIEAALSHAPILATVRNGKLVVEDGYHRLGVAFHVFGKPAVRVLFAEVSASRVQSNEEEGVCL